MTDLATPDASRAEPFLSQVDYWHAVDELTEANRRYYGDGDSRLDDVSYDALRARVEATETANPDWGQSSVTTEVAGGALAGGDIVHTVGMLSLDNVFDADQLAGWYERLTKAAGRQVTRMTVEPKMDGLAIAARYVDGALTLVATRGDGYAGEDVTAVAKTAAGLPHVLAEPVTMEVRGEVYMSEADFETANENRVAAGGNPFANPRNAAAGTLRNQNRTYEAPLSFAAYQLVDHPAAEDRPYDKMMAWLEDLGFATASSRVGGIVVASDIVEVQAAIDSLSERRPNLGFAIDGAVVKAALPADRAEAGSSSRAPRWGIAWKYAADMAMTTLVDIEVEVGRTGIIAPRAVLEPVFVGGTTITYATLHNADEIARLDVRIGDTVWVMRAGEVIPRVTGPNLDLRPEGTVPWEAPTSCPRCESDIDKSEKRWRCVRGRDCNLLASLKYFCERDAMDIEGAGVTVLAKLIEAGLVADVAGIYDLTVDQLAGLDRMGETSAQNIIDQINKSKSQPLNKVFCALGIRGTGRSLSRKIAKHFGTLDAIRAATVAQLAEVEKVGPVKAEYIAAELAELSAVIDRLVAAGINTVEPTVVAEAPEGLGELPFVGKTVVVSGTVPGLTRNEANEWVERLGGKSSGSVSKNTSLAVLGDGAGSKADKAAANNVPVMDAGVFSQLVDAWKAGDIDAVTGILSGF